MIISVLVLGIAGYASYNPKSEVKLPNMRDFPFNQSTGKEKLIQSKTGDASLYIETLRRKTIGGTYRSNLGKTIQETQHTVGTAGGAMEAFILSWK
jgi:hypothetical protein